MLSSYAVPAGAPATPRTCQIAMSGPGLHAPKLHQSLDAGCLWKVWPWVRQLSLAQTIPREGCQLRVIWKHSLQQGNESFIPETGFGQHNVASTIYSSLDFISHIEMLISICLTPISQMVYYMRGKKERNLWALELSAAWKSALSSSIPQLWVLPSSLSIPATKARSQQM